MPPWPARLHLGSLTVSHTPSSSREKGERGLLHSHQPLVDQSQDPPLLDVPILNPVVPSPSRDKSRHGRSLSNPFNVIFGSGKKMESVVDAESENDAPDTLEYPPRPSTGLSSKDVMAGMNGSSVQHGVQDFLVGKCRTCDCFMKWPRQVDSYRCQVCLMVNDLKPLISPIDEVFPAGNSSSIELKNCEVHHPATL